MHVIFILIAALLGAAGLGIPGCILGGVVGYLAAELVILKKRVVLLESQSKAASVKESEEIVFSPVEPDDVHHTATADTRPKASEQTHTTTHTAASLIRAKSETTPARKIEKTETASKAKAEQSPYKVDAIVSSLENALGKGIEPIRHFLTGGNLVLKAGLIIIFFGVAFLIKYAAQRNLVSIELRLIAAAIFGCSLLAIGWRLRNKAPVYGQGLQGGGVGILYLVVFGAAKLYSLLPMPLALGVMVGLVAVSGALAVLQDSRGLAIFGTVGGFLAPVLMSTGTGSHVMLFSYFGLLNLGILGIAWFKAWRELNLIGFFFTFGIGTLWGSNGYQPEFFSSTEPFLIGYFLFYVAISVLFAHRQPVKLKGYIDGPLVFGLPLVVSGLQYLLVKDMQYGMAISSFSFGFFYLLLATVLWRRLAEGMRLLCEAFLAMGVVFASLTIPLALDSQWTTAAWALEGAAMVWIGVRQKRALARFFALLLQFGAAWTFVESVFYPFGAVSFLNSYFFSCVFLSISALFSSYYINKYKETLYRWERFLPIPLLIWGICWWYYGGIRETDRHFAAIKEYYAFLLFSCGSTMFMSIVARKTEWRQLAVAQLVLLPIMVIVTAIGMIDLSYRSHLLAEWGKLVWFVAFFSQYRMLHQFDSLWPKRLAGYWHIATLWLLLIILGFEASWLTDITLELNEVWTIVCWGVIPAAAIFMIIRWSEKIRWPLSEWKEYYKGAGIAIPAVMLVVYSVLTLGESGDPAPIMYVPVFNPLELSLFFVLLVLFSWAMCCRRGACTLSRFIPVNVLYWIVVILCFFWLNGVVARAVHFYIGIPYHFDSLYYSVVFQAAVSALWSLVALSATVWAARTGNRLVWACGAVLLGLVVAKLFMVDLSGTGTVARIVSFLSVGILMLVIGYFSPMPPKKDEEAV
ncbi:DUF2339 domain-containing protein [Desulfosediminicola flagellatus]|uniref:DUF2339 domain-containing protein n=1 Tax=Desulfosediminicola flagellatus TaxID=2569541 RepID=UPI0010AD7ED3|nr:DUF2339 domain-containing protein [Desulfosediminicola flagellatus]